MTVNLQISRFLKKDELLVKIGVYIPFPGGG